MIISRPSIFTTLTKGLARLPLWLLVLLSLVGYGLLALWFPLLSNYDHAPLLDIRSFTPSMPAGIAYGFLICSLFGLFILAFRCVRRSSRPLGLLPTLGVSSLLALPLLIAYPINANDIYRYVIRGRITNIYGENPFTIAPAAHPEDPFLPLAGEWAAETSPYGPMWELVASGITAVTGDDLLLGLLSFKILILLAFVGTIVVLWTLLRSPGVIKAPNEMREVLVERSANTVLWAWNPALLLIFMVNGHNDALMIFWLLLGLLVMQRGFPAFGFLLMLLGALTKPIGILALPMFFVSALRDSRSVLERVRFVFAAVAGGLLLILLLFLPFGSPVELVQRLMREAGAGGGFSPAVLALLLAQNDGIELTAGSIARLASFLFVLFAIFVLWLLGRTWQGRSPIRGTADIFFGYLAQALNYRIWYAAWPFPWLLLDAASKPENQSAAFRLHYGLWFLLTSQLSVLIYGHVRIYALGGSQLLAHLLGVGFTFTAPLFLAWLSKGGRQLIAGDESA